MKTGDILLEGRALSLRYGQTPVLERIDFTVRVGEFWFIVGPNGSGKSTLLKAIVGVLTPERGEIRLDPIVLDRAQIGFVPQSCRFNPSLPTTIREFVLLGLMGVKTARKEAAERPRLGARQGGSARHGEARLLVALGWTAPARLGRSSARALSLVTDHG